MVRFLPPGIGRLLAILALGLALWAGAAARACADDPLPSIFWGGCEPMPRAPWYVSSDGLAMQRIFSGLGPAATLGMSPSGSVALSQQSLDDPFQAGIRMLAGHTFEETPYQVEVSYFWLNPLATYAQAASTTGNLFSPFTNFGATVDSSVDNNSFVEIHLVSRLEGGEFNLKSQLPLPEGDPNIALFFGVRHIGLREEFDYTSTPTGNPNPVTVHAHTNNNIWGPQIGGQVDYGHQDVWLHFEGRAAICNNEADRELEASIAGTNATHPRLSDSGTAMAADISAAIVWHPTAALSARVGYQALWIDQVALAARNFISDPATLTNPLADPPVNRRGTLIYQGPFAGLQLNW